MVIAREAEKEEMFQNNLKLLNGWLKDAVLQIDDKALWNTIEIIWNDEGYPICRYHREEQCVQINSMRPVQEAQRWYQTVSDHGTGAIFLYGTGFGYPLFEVFQRKQEHTLVVVFEHDLYLLKAMLYYFDLTPIIETHKIVFLAGDSSFFAPVFDHLFFSQYFMSCSFPSVAFTYPARRQFKEHYLDIHNYVFTQLSLLVFYLGNDHQDTLIGLMNAIGNTKEILENPYISCLKDQYKGYPAFVISNGPSLDQNIRDLSEIRGRGLIISVESAIKPLLKQNIRPDILSIVERTKATYTCHFKDMEYPDDIALLSLNIVDKRVYPSFPGVRIPIFRDGEALNRWMNRYLGDGSDIEAGINVSHLAAEIGVYLGANPIVFVGQDFAYGTDGVTHSKASVYYEEGGQKARKTVESMPLVYVEGNHGKQIPSNQLWTDFRLGLERKIARHPDHLFINATEGGAKIEGTRCERLRDVIETYCKKQIPRRVNEIISENKSLVSITERKEKLSEFIKSAEEYAKLFYELAKKTIGGMLKCKEMIRFSLHGSEGYDPSAPEKAYHQNLSLINEFMTNYICLCFSQQIIFAHYFYMNHLGMIDTQEKTAELFQLQYECLRSLYLISQSVSVHMERAAESLRDVLQDFDIPNGGNDNEPA